MKMIITDNETKLNMLKDESDFHDYKFISKNDFFRNLFFDFDYKTVTYLMEKENKKVDAVLNILNSLYVIDESKEYKNKKLIHLQEIKKDLTDNSFLIFNDNFKNYLQRFSSLDVRNVFLEKHEKEALNELNLEVNYIEEKPLGKTIPICKYETFEEEIFGVLTKIRELLDEGIDINKIFLTNVTKDNFFLLERCFDLFNIPVSLPKKISIVKTRQVREFLKTGDLSVIEDKTILNKVTAVLNNLVEIKNDKYYQEVLEYNLKHIYLDNITLKNSVRTKELNTIFLEDEYVFLLSFNSDIIPKYVKDDSYITDDLKDEVNIYKTYEKNKIIKETTLSLLRSINNLYLTYHLYDDKEMAISNLAKELSLEEVEGKVNYNISDKYNRLKLSEYLYDYNNYNVQNEDLELLCSNYESIYNSYDNSFTGIDKSDYLDYVKKPLTLSFSSLDNYNQCGFKYYIRNVLKMDKYDEVFSIFIGNLFHYILSLKDEDNFNFEREWNKYLEKKELTNKESVLLSFVKDDFKMILEKMNEMMESSLFKKSYSEVPIEEKLDKEIEVIFKGIIDKIITFQNVNDTYYAVIDYKTYDKRFDLNNVLYGLDMQLVIYTYLIGKSNLLKNPIFAGMYFEKVINSKREEEPDIRLTGFSTDNLAVLEKLDSNYINSKIIKGLGFTKEGNFKASSKLLSEEEQFNLTKLVKEKIENSVDDILDAKFDINPKKIDKENISCKYCEYRDLCFVKEKDIIELEKTDIKEYLGGDLNA